MALDLTRDVPRSPFDEIDGFPWLPRLIDKVRAWQAGTLGDYSAYPCPGDRGFLKAFGLEAAPLGDLIKGGATDEAVGAWVSAHAQNGGEASKAAFRQEQNVAHANPFFKLIARIMAWKNRQDFARKTPPIDWRRIKTIAQVIAAQEGHPIP